MIFVSRVADLLEFYITKSPTLNGFLLWTPLIPCSPLSSLTSSFTLLNSTLAFLVRNCSFCGMSVSLPFICVVSPVLFFLPRSLAFIHFLNLTVLSTFPSVRTDTDLGGFFSLILTVVTIFLGLVLIFFLGFFLGSKSVLSDEEEDGEEEDGRSPVRSVSLLCH